MSIVLRGHRVHEGDHQRDERHLLEDSEEKWTVQYPTSRSVASRASAASTCCTWTELGAKNASPASSAPPRARPTASTSSRPTTPGRPKSGLAWDERFAEVYNIDYGRSSSAASASKPARRTPSRTAFNFELSVYSRADLLKTKDYRSSRSSGSRTITASPSPKRTWTRSTKSLRKLLAILLAVSFNTDGQLEIARRRCYLARRRF